MKAVRFDRYGGVDVREVREVEDPVAGPGRVMVAVKAPGLNPGEMSIRESHLHERCPATFPSGEGTDLADVVQAVGDDVTGFEDGDEVLGWTEEHASRAGLVTAPADQSTATRWAVNAQGTRAIWRIATSTARDAHQRPRCWAVRLRPGGGPRAASRPASEPTPSTPRLWPWSTTVFAVRLEP